MSTGRVLALIKGVIGSMSSGFSGATDESDGSFGFVPAPSSAERTLYLRADGTWANPDSKQEAMPSPSDANPQGLGTASPGTSADYSRADHVHPIPAQIVTNAVAMSTGAIDVSAGTVFTKTITANTTISFSNVPAAPATACVTLILTNGGSKTVTWPSSVKWSGGTAPNLTASGVDVLTFLTVNGGTTCYGTVNSLGAA